MNVKRGEVYWANISGGMGSEQNGYRPVVIIQNNIGNKFSPTTIVAVLTNAFNEKKNLPTHKIIDGDNFKNKVGAKKEGFITSRFLGEQLKTIDMMRLETKIGELKPEIMKDLDKCILVSLGLHENIG